MQKHQAHVLGSCTVYGIFIIVLYLFSGNNIDRKGLSIIVFLFIWTKLVLSHNRGVRNVAVISYAWPVIPVYNLCNLNLDFVNTNP